MNNLNAEISTPLYQQLYDTLKKQIESGQYCVGEKIPSEEQLSKLYNISRITVRNALQHLVDEHILLKKKGKGTYVAEPVRVESMSAGNSFTKSCLQINAVPGTRLISLSKELAGKKIGAIFQIRPDEFIICLKRLRLIDGMAAIYEVDYFKQNFDFLLKGEFEGISLIEYLRKFTGIYASSIEDIYQVSYAAKEHSQYLECKVGTPLLQVDQTIFTSDGDKYYYNEQFIRSDRYKYAMRSMIN